MTYSHNRAPALRDGLSGVEASNYAISGGVARGRNSKTIALFKDLQVQANRLAAVHGLTRVVVDGAIGPNTINLVKQVGAKTNFMPAQVLNTAADVAMSADTTRDVFEAFANKLGVPLTVGMPTPGPATGGTGGGIKLPANFPPSFPAPPPAAPPDGGPLSPGIIPPMLSAGFPGGETGVLAAVGLLGILWFTRKKGKGARAMRAARRRPGAWKKGRR